MFTAKCSYLSKVLSPADYKEKSIQLWDYQHQMKLEGSYYNDLFAWAPNHVGYDRYASEHWLGTHPDLVPCDVSSTIVLKHWQKEKERNYLHEFVWNMAPRQPILNAPWDWHNYCDKTFNITIATANDNRFQQYFLLRGAIYRWTTFYQQIASRSSWVWTWFPDGSRWYNAVQRYGLNVLQEVIQTDPHLDTDDEFLINLRVVTKDTPKASARRTNMRMK
jgi:hypothetical protein